MHRSAEEAASRSSVGAEDARLAAESISVLSEQTRAATDVVDGFRLMTSEIDKLINSITGMSHQTHLLAINADRGRPGRRGRSRLRCVAEEVSRLSDSVRRFAEQISEISEEIMLRSSEVAEQIRHNVKYAEELREMVVRSAASFDGILSAIEGTARAAGQIYEMTEQQRDSATDLTTSLSTISLIAERNANGTAEASASHHEQIAAMVRNESLRPKSR